MALDSYGFPMLSDNHSRKMSASYCSIALLYAKQAFFNSFYIFLIFTGRTSVKLFLKYTHKYTFAPAQDNMINPGCVKKMKNLQASWFCCVSQNTFIDG